MAIINRVRDMSKLKVPTRQERVLELIRIERKYQDEKWGKIEGRLNISNERWMTILAEEVGEVARQVQDGDANELLTELVQVAAVATVWMEKILCLTMGRPDEYYVKSREAKFKKK